MNIPQFEDAKHIGRNNLAKFAWKNAHGPELGLTYRLKKWFERTKNRYNSNQAFADLVDFSLLILLACAAFVGIFTVLLYSLG